MNVKWTKHIIQNRTSHVQKGEKQTKRCVNVAFIILIEFDILELLVGNKRRTRHRSCQSINVDERYSGGIGLLDTVPYLTINTHQVDGINQIKSVFLSQAKNRTRDPNPWDAMGRGRTLKSIFERIINARSCYVVTSCQREWYIVMGNKSNIWKWPEVLWFDIVVSIIISFTNPRIARKALIFHRHPPRSR